MSVPPTLELPSPPSKLSVPHELFCQELMRNGGCLVDAYKAIYPRYGTEAAALANGYRLRARQDVRERLDELTRLAAQHAVIDRAVLLQELYETATADPAEISRVVTEPCSTCWSDDLAFAAAADRAIVAGTGWPDPDTPQSGCHTCRGHGVQRVVHTDTANLRGPARRLYQGARQRADGSIEVRQIDQLAARKELHELLGLKVNRNLSVTAHVHVEPMRDMTPAEIAELIQQQKLVK